MIPTDDMEETRILRSGVPCHELNTEPEAVGEASIVWLRGDQRVKIEKQTLTIGKMSGKVDFVVGGNPAISRIHARIIRNGQTEYRIEDLKALNGTFVNEQPVGQDGMLLRNGDIIRLADEEFEFEVK